MLVVVNVRDGALSVKSSDMTAIPTILLAANFVSKSCLVFNHLHDHEGWPHHEPLTATDICLPQLSTVVQLTTLSKM